MYQLLIAAAVLGLASDPSHAAAPWTHCRSEGEEDAPTLVTSANAPLALVREYTLTLSRTGPGAQGLTLDAHQATDVYNLLNLLGGERPEQSTEDCQPMGSELQP